MHTSRFGTLTVIHNSDYSGEAMLSLPKDKVETTPSSDHVIAYVSGEDILKLAAHIVSQQRESAASRMTAEETLAFPFPVKKAFTTPGS